ncbi:MAG: PemK-like protein [Chloroflexi bacterium]|nr:PemK-like protein [Chloroflexota bacterium]
MARRGSRLAEVLRGGIYWADLDPVRGHEQGGSRPVLVLSHDLFNERSGTVVAVALTAQPQRAGYPLTWRVPDDLLSRPSWVKVSQVRTLSTGRLGDQIAQLRIEDVEEIVRGLLQLID